MKILTNIRFYRVAGIAQSLQAFLDYLERTPTGISVIGVNVMKPNEIQETAPVRHPDVLTVRSLTVDYPEIGSLMQQTGSLADIAEQLRPIIEFYALVIREERPDVIVINGTYFLPWCLLRASRLFRIPTVVHYHGLISKETEHWDDRARALFRQMEQDFDRAEIHYVFPSELARRTVEQEVFGHLIQNASVLPNGIRDHFFQPPAMVPKKKNPVIGFVSRWTRIKNTRFIECFSKYAHRKKNGRYRIAVVTDAQINPTITERLKKFITFKRPSSQAKLARFYRACGIVLSPSRFETYGNVAQEAVACGTPSLVSEQMGVAETFRKIGLDDLIIDFSCPKRVLENIEMLLNYPIPQETIETLRKNFSNEKISAEFVQILKSIA